jgi:hypothetical protein
MEMTRSASEEILDEALFIIKNDINKIKHLASSSTTLDATEARKLNDYVRTLLSITKDERDEIKSANYVSKTDKEMHDLAERAAQYLGVTKKETT